MYLKMGGGRGGGASVWACEGGGGGRVGVNQELKVLYNLKKRTGGGQGRGRGCGVVREPRIEGIVQLKKKRGGGGGRVGGVVGCGPRIEGIVQLKNKN